MNLLIDFSIHKLILIVSFFGIVVSVIQFFRYPHRIGYMIAPITYILNVFSYNLALHYGLLNFQNLEIWSGIVRLHSLFLFIIYIIIQPIKKAGE